MAWCFKKGLECDNVSSTGECNQTACTKTQTIKISSEHCGNLVRTCEICGHGTEDMYHHICAKCRLKLHSLLYKDDDFGRGTYV